VQPLGRVLARRAAAEVAVDQQDRRLAVAAIVERVLRPGAVACSGSGALVFEEMMLESFEGHRAQEPRRHDAVGVDVVAPHGERGAFDDSQFLNHVGLSMR
jgi:hypothetical protein